MMGIRKLIFTILLALPLCAMSARGGNASADSVGEEVIAHYAKAGDTLRLKAARFLVDNMRHHAYYDSPLLHRYYSRAEQIGHERDYRKRMTLFRELYAELGDIGSGKQEVGDAAGLTAEALIANIDSAFVDWRQGRWARHLSFPEFCEWLLPYRVADERPERWRGRLSAVYRPYAEALDSCDERAGSAYWAARAVASGLADSGYRMDDKALPHTDIDLPVSTMVAMGMGECSNYARLSVFVMRACGIPVALDFTPQWANKAHRHWWNALLSERGQVVPFLGGDVLPGESQRSADRLAKVYRRTFAYRPESAAALNEEFGELLPPTLSSPFMADVSDEYFRGGSVSLTLPETVLKRRLAYLAVFDNAEWVPVCHSVVDSLRRVSFGSLGRGVAYLPVYWGRAGSIPCGNPFAVLADGSIKTFSPDSVHTVTLTLTRKYPVFGRIYDFARSLQGGYIEACDTAWNKDAVRIADITGVPSTWWNAIDVSKAGRHRFWRLVAPPNSHCDVAELAFVGKDGRPVAAADTLCDDMRHDGKKIREAFDGDAVSYFRSTHFRKAWIGIDMGKPSELGAVRFMPRNDGNHVEPGHTYQSATMPEARSASSKRCVPIATALCSKEYLRVRCTFSMTSRLAQRNACSPWKTEK